MILYCRKCSHVWKYGGAAEKETSCPDCKSWVNLQVQQLPPVLPEGGDYSAASFLGVTEDDSILYYDCFSGVVVSFVGPQDPFSRSEETPVAPEALEQHLKEVHWAEGLKFRAGSLTPIKITGAVIRDALNADGVLVAVSQGSRAYELRHMIEERFRDAQGDGGEDTSEMKHLGRTLVVGGLELYEDKDGEIWAGDESWVVPLSF